MKIYTLVEEMPSGYLKEVYRTTDKKVIINQRERFRKVYKKEYKILIRTR
jgi:hypothetical protein